MTQPVTVDEIDRLCKFLRAEANRLDVLAEHRNVKWATDSAKSNRRIVEVLLELRRTMQMTTMSGKRLDQRPDQAAIDAIPELQDKKALVCYFATDKDRDEFSDMLVQLMPTARSERIP